MSVTHERTRSARVLTSAQDEPAAPVVADEVDRPLRRDLLELADEPRDVLLLRRAEARRAAGSRSRGAAARSRRRAADGVRSASQTAGVSGTP